MKSLDIIGDPSFNNNNNSIISIKQAEIKPMVNAGIKGFKCFLVHSGVDEFPCVSEDDVRLAMTQMQGTDAVFLVCVMNHFILSGIFQVAPCS